MRKWGSSLRYYEEDIIDGLKPYVQIDKMYAMIKSIRRWVILEFKLMKKKEDFDFQVLNLQNFITHMVIRKYRQKS